MYIKKIYYICICNEVRSITTYRKKLHKSYQESTSHNTADLMGFFYLI
ncbi:hypothetical protein HWC92_gp42 [Flavobacterium phage vB_FspS_morran9-1]|uniref:Uncharacterized protein n=1 Tax=Flavobacterium phage vB_FspS_morran9-1 TaxID=2686258 RepID=A0A6B9LCA4_9CAUD|nr:hypothetical protein HWC92_gp42 [Flavobacterium phage vB_FspS_morran9-1]QHB39576.1 hypothetical protein morran91_gp042 [Flavobacterium phage vB_FspS_morran9-1]